MIVIAILCLLVGFFAGRQTGNRGFNPAMMQNRQQRMQNRNGQQPGQNQQNPNDQQTPMMSGNVQTPNPANMPQPPMGNTGTTNTTGN